MTLENFMLMSDLSPIEFLSWQAYKLSGHKIKSDIEQIRAISLKIKNARKICSLHKDYCLEVEKYFPQKKETFYSNNILKGVHLCSLASWK